VVLHPRPDSELSHGTRYWSPGSRSLPSRSWAEVISCQSQTTSSRLFSPTLVVATPPPASHREITGRQSVIPLSWLQSRITEPLSKLVLGIMHCAASFIKLVLTFWPPLFSHQVWQEPVSRQKLQVTTLHPAVPQKSVSSSTELTKSSCSNSSPYTQLPEEIALAPTIWPLMASHQTLQPTLFKAQSAGAATSVQGWTLHTTLHLAH